MRGAEILLELLRAARQALDLLGELGRKLAALAGEIADELLERLQARLGMRLAHGRLPAADAAVEGAEALPPRAARFRIVAASPSSATTSSTAPRAMASRGMPNTTHDASSWASVCGAGFLHLDQALRPVVAHSGHEHADRARAGRLRGRPEEHVDARPVAGDERPVRQLDHVRVAAPAHEDVPVARGDQREAGPHAVAVGGFLHFHAAQAVQARREGRRESLRHVLDDDDPRPVGRHLLEQLRQRLRPARGGAHHDDAVGRHPDARPRARRQDGVGRQARRGGQAALADAGLGGAAHGVEEDHRRLVEELADVDARLRHDRERALVEGPHREVRPVAGQRGAHHHRDGVLRHDPRKEGEAVHARQLEVEHDHVGPLLAHLLHGDVGIGRDRRRDALEREERRQGLPHDRRVVDDEHLERAFRRHAVRASGRPGARAPFGSACV